ncbi:MAG: MBL fold metallo-hydrolase [Bacteroidetes bacterium]|nr:MBL fold metallo-hydrolase [Bacteroidota bacterium]
MKITFLGTGTSQGVPVIACACEVCKSTDPRDNRLRTSIMVEDEHTTVVIDSGPDFRQQMLRAGVLKLDGLLFTHEHKDHIAGMDDIRAFNYINQKPVDIYATKEVQDAIKREFHYAFDAIKYPGVPELNLHTIINEPFQIGTITFTPIRIKHYLLEIFGFRIGDFTYITDAKTIPEEEHSKIFGSKYLVLNALRKEPHVSHFTLDEAIQMMKYFAPEQGFLIHLSHQMGLHSEVEAGLPDGIKVAYDGLVVEN